MAAQIKESTLNILNYLREHNDEDLTHEDIAEALDVSPKSVTGSFNSFVRKKWGYRVESEIEVDGKHKGVNFLKLTELGMTVDPMNPPEED